LGYGISNAEPALGEDLARVPVSVDILQPGSRCFQNQYVSHA
jgi:hypothetical protein